MIVDFYNMEITGTSCKFCIWQRPQGECACPEYAEIINDVIENGFWKCKKFERNVENEMQSEKCNKRNDMANSK